MKIAALQMQARTGDVEANLARIERAAREAAAAGARLLIAPELALTSYGAGDAIPVLAEPADGAVVTRLDAIAREAGLAIVTGFAEAAEGATWNSAVFVDGSRRPVVYRKSHLFAEYEHGLFRAAAPSAVTVEHEGLTLGFLICYDVEFPENVRRLARVGCGLVVVPTALPANDDQAFIASKMIPVRAFENQLFVAYVDHCGTEGDRVYAGLTTIAAPSGAILAQAGEHGEELLVVDLRPQDYAASRARNTYLRDLRT